MNAWTREIERLRVENEWLRKEAASWLKFYIDRLFDYIKLKKENACLKKENVRLKGIERKLRKMVKKDG